MPRIVCKNMDPQELESRFSNEKNFFFDQEESGSGYQDFAPFIKKLPKREIDLIEMYYTSDKKQKEIAEYFSVTQGAISHRLSRACKRLRFLRDMPKINGELNDILKKYFTDFEIDVIKFMIDTTCQSRTAYLLNIKYRLRGDNKMTQVKVRHKFERFIDRVKKLKKHDNNLLVCYKLMEYVRNNLYMMHEVVLPHFNRGYRANIRKIM